LTISHLTVNTLYSRRRRAVRAQNTLPDWVWGAGLGTIVIIFAGAFFVIRSVTGGGDGGICDKELPPLDNSQVDAEGFISEDAALGRVINMLNAGDRQGAEAAFYGPVHNFTHAADPPLRETDEALAKDLCNAVIDLETSLEQSASNPLLASQVAEVRDLLRDAADALGYPRPG
jgi:hypothetical protein